MEGLPMSIREVRCLLREGGVSVPELVEAFLQRLGDWEPHINAFVAVDREGALEQARKVQGLLDAGAEMSLAGVPVAFKDTLAVRGLPLTYGTRLLEENWPQEDGTSAHRLRAAGAIIVGKNNLDPFGRGAAGDNPWYGNVRNPWNGGFIPGGSSGGCAAAVAARVVLAAVGSDGGGSIRAPAAINGVTAIKPTLGRMSRHNPQRSTWATCVCDGPLATCVEDLALVMEVLDGYDPADPTTAKVSVPRYSRLLSREGTTFTVGLPRRYFFDRLDPQVGRAIEDAIGLLARRGVKFRDVDLPHVKYAEEAWRAIVLPERAVEGSPVPVPLWEQLPFKYRALQELGQFVPATHYIRGRQVRQVLRQELAEAFGQVDALLTPTCAITEVPAEAHAAVRRKGDVFGDTRTVVVGDREENAFDAVSRLVRPFNLTGNPALTVPCGFTRAGIPIGMQLVGPDFGELGLLQLGFLYQRETDWHRRVPSLPRRGEG